MKVTNLQFKSIDELNKKLDISDLRAETTLIQVFSGLVLQKEVSKIQSIIKRKNGAITFIGATTAGEIYEGAAYEQSIIISILEFENTSVKGGYFTGEDDHETGKHIASSLFKNDTKALILFIDGLETNANDLLDGISSLKSSIPLAGGLAGDNGYLSKTFVFDNQGVYSKGCVAVALNSQNLHVFTKYQLNWQPVGKLMTVTKAHKNRLYEIDGINVSDVYTKYLGERVGDNLPYSATEFPLLKMEENGLEVCRVFTHRFEDGSLLTIGNLNAGDKVRFAFGNVDLILSSTKENIKRYRSLKPEALFVYSCTSRKTFLQEEITAELAPLSKIAPNAGFFTYGEIYHYQNTNALLNVSMTLLALSEHKYNDTSLHEDSTEERNEQNFIANKHFLVLEALTHLSNTVITELEEAQKQLKEQANRDYLTGLYNRRYFNEIAQDLIYISKREQKVFSVILLDIDKFKYINDTYGHNVGDDVLKILSNTLVETLRESDIIARFGGEEFAILLPFTDIEGARVIAEKLRTTVANKKVITPDGDIIRFTVSLGVTSILPDDKSIDQTVNRADKALYKAKRSGRNRVVVS